MSAGATGKAVGVHLAVASLAVVACGGAGPGAGAGSADASGHARDAAPAGARYVLGGLDWSIETEGKIARVIAARSRFELDGDRVVAVAPPEPTVERGMRFPAWATAGKLRFVFWDQREVYGAETFTGPLVKIARLRSPVRDASPWLDGVGIVSGSGFLVVRSDGGRLGRAPHPGLGFGVAADAKRGVAQSRLGETWWTVDGGATFQRIPADLGDVYNVRRVGADLAIDFEGGGERFVTPSGKLAERRESTDVADEEESEDEADAWPEDESDIWWSVASAAVRLGPRTGFVVGSQHFGLLDIDTGKVASVGELPLDLGDCQPFAAGGAPLLACRDTTRAYVFDVGSEVRLERVFARPADPRMDTFVGSEDGSLGFVGPCAGYAPSATPDDSPDATSGATPLNPYPQRTRVFCVRDERGQWFEHGLDPADAADVVSWIPRRGGAAVALVGRRGTAHTGEPRIGKDGPLRVVRVAREEPPLGLPRYSYSGGELIRRDLWVSADSSIHGWLPAQGAPAGIAAITVSPEGLARQWPTPASVTSLAARGRFGLAVDEDQALYETVDGGRSWRAVERPPGDPMSSPSQCTELGCSIGAFVRIGWDGVHAPDEPPSPPKQDPRAYYGRQEPSVEPLVRLSCAYSGAPRSVRQTGDFGFGVSATPVPQPQSAGRVGIAASLELPQSSGQPPLTGEVTGAWLRPFDVTGEIRRKTVDLAGLDIQYPPYRTDLGVVTRGKGDVEPMVIGSSYNCPAALLERLGMVRPFGGCHPDPSVGVDLGDGVVFFSAQSNELVVQGLGVRFGGTRSNATLTPLADRTWIGSLDRRLAGGLRGATPVVIAMDAEGDASLVPFDAGNRKIGAEVAIAPFTRLALGDQPACRGDAPDEARVAMRLTSEIGLVQGSLPGAVTLGTDGFAALRWSPTRVCLDAFDVEISDERWQQYLQRYVPHNASRRLVGRFGGEGEARAAIVVIEAGAEIVQPVACTGALP